MRGIKVRAWDAAEGKMIYDFGEPIGGEGGLLLYLVTQMEDMTIGVVREGDGNQLPLMQFTGLLDKNGREIYEGDILADESNFPGVIVWHKETASFVVDFKDDLQDIVDIGKWASIIGNIYEPELLS